jgi:hypothetical protein
MIVCEFVGFALQSKPLVSHIFRGGRRAASVGKEIFVSVKHREYDQNDADSSLPSRRSLGTGHQCQYSKLACGSKPHTPHSRPEQSPTRDKTGRWNVAMWS